jgi:hypothetical protein
MAKKKHDPDKNLENKEARDANRDPITGAPGSHPVGTGIGAAGGGAAGAAIGSVIPGAGTVVGAVAGAAIGAVAGGVAGKAAAEAVNPTEEDAYWRENYQSRPYVEQGRDYAEYEPAYRHGYTAYTRYPERNFEEIEPDLRRDWETARGETSDLDWDRGARDASRDAWQRVRDRGVGASQHEANPKLQDPDVRSDNIRNDNVRDVR